MRRLTVKSGLMSVAAASLVLGPQLVVVEASAATPGVTCQITDPTGNGQFKWKICDNVSFPFGNISFHEIVLSPMGRAGVSNLRVGGTLRGESVEQSAKGDSANGTARINIAVDRDSEVSWYYSLLPVGSGYGVF